MSGVEALRKTKQSEEKIEENEELEKEEEKKEAKDETVVLPENEVSEMKCEENRDLSPSEFVMRFLSVEMLLGTACI